jgi:hypothetical protein
MTKGEGKGRAEGTGAEGKLSALLGTIQRWNGSSQKSVNESHYKSDTISFLEPNIPNILVV